MWSGGCSGGRAMRTLLASLRTMSIPSHQLPQHRRRKARHPKPVTNTVTAIIMTTMITIITKGT